jgi:2-polyprenyl-3-methyl-5-hydroxy-6-metoxy-1,4-benzoquinol methylase
MKPDLAQVRADFDEIAHLVPTGASGVDRYDPFLRSLIPQAAVAVLDVGCGLGRLAAAIATDQRHVVGIDLSPAMIARATRDTASRNLSFRCDDFLTATFATTFDCIVSAAALHHVSEDAAITRMIALLRPGGRLIIHDLRRDTTVAETMRAYAVLCQSELKKLMTTGSLLSPRRVRQVWSRHCAAEHYLSLSEAKAMADRLLPGARVFDHWLWRYTIVWDKKR